MKNNSTKLLSTERYSDTHRCKSINCQNYCKCLHFKLSKMYIFDWLGYSAIADADAEAQKKK